MNLLLLLDYLGVAVFAATGALAASRKQLDFVGFVFLACLAGMGGGTVRDLVLGAPVFWVGNGDFLLVCGAVALAVYFLAPLIEQRYRLLLWLDAVGVAAYCVMGAAKGFALGASAPVAVVMGVLTATFGGILRDVISEEPSVLLRGEIYVTAALAGSTSYAILASLPIDLPYAALIGALLAFAIRAGAIAQGWSLPRYRPRPPRKP